MFVGALGGGRMDAGGLLVWEVRGVGCVCVGGGDCGEGEGVEAKS